MSKINGARVVLGGLLAGVIINTSEFVLNTSVVGKDWEEVWRQLGRDPAEVAASIPIWILWSFLVGIFGTWIYAAIRPRFGPGPRTAVYAGIALWATVYLTFALAMVAMQLLPDKLIWLSLFWGLAEAILAVLVAGWVYKEA